MAAIMSPERLGTGLQQWLDAWRSSRQDITPHRKRADETRINKYITPYLHDRSVTRMSSRAVEAWLQQLRDDGVGNATIYACLMILRQAINLSVEAGVAQSNPTHGIHVRGVNEIRPPADSEILSEDQVQALYASIDPAYRALMLFCVRTGARWEEALGMREEDFDLRSGRAVIGRWRVTEQSGATVEVEGNGSRIVDLTLDVIKAVREHLNETKSWRSPGSTWVFLTKRDHRHPLRPNFTLHTWRPALRSAGMDDRSVTFHGLRHTAAVYMIRHQKKTAAEVAAALGHAAESTTRKMYRKYFIEAAADRPPVL